MKRLAIIMALTMLCLLAGCRMAEETATPTPAPVPSAATTAEVPELTAEPTPKALRGGDLGIDFSACESILSAEDYEALSRFFPVLMEGECIQIGIEPIMNAENWEPTAMSLADFAQAKEFVGEAAQPYRVKSFALCDMDQDGDSELVLAFDNSTGTYLVLHYNGEECLGVVLYERWIQALQTNGVYMGSGGAAYHIYKRMGFEPGGVQTEVIASYDDGLCQIGGVEVTQAEYDAWEEANTPGEAVWH